MKIAFRIDISSEIGTGHYVRMSALADVFSEIGHICAFFEGKDEPIDYGEYDIIILDSYLLNDKYIAELDSLGKTIVCYDDNALYTYNCDIVLNANFHSKELNFKYAGKKPKMLLGGKYALLRKEFRNSKVITVNEDAACVFICFGGSDVRNMTPKVINALKYIDDISLSVVLGGYTKNDDEVYAVASDNVIIYKTPESMVEIMAGCDIAVTSSGSITYELAALGLPSIIISQADNQVPISDYMSQNKLMKNLGNWIDYDSKHLKSETIKLLKDYRRRMAESKRLLSQVDKNGAVNAAREILMLRS